jgi:polyketide cyclase/dehydrase/lipid transport protein
VMIALVLAAAGGHGPAWADETVVALADTGSAPAIAAAATVGSNDVAVRVSKGPQGIEVEGRCFVDAPATAAWSVLTDYDGIDKFVSSIRESRVSRDGDGQILVDQVAVGHVFLFSRHFRVTLRVDEEPPGRIRFEDILHKDFVSYRGEWQIEGTGSRVEIVYRVSAQPSFSVPGFIARGLFKRTVSELLGQVREEIVRRATLAKR